MICAWHKWPNSHIQQTRDCNSVLTKVMMIPLQRILRLPASLAAFKRTSVVQQEGLFLNMKRNISCAVALNSSVDSGKQLPKIYTKTGDKGRCHCFAFCYSLSLWRTEEPCFVFLLSILGRSSLYTGERRAKDDRIFSALGAIDELSCQVIILHNAKCL